jgi:hypothetical protein
MNMKKMTIKNENRQTPNHWGICELNVHAPTRRFRRQKKNAGQLGDSQVTLVNAWSRYNHLDQARTKSNGRFVQMFENLDSEMQILEEPDSR